MSEFIGLRIEKRYDEAAGKMISITENLKNAGAELGTD
jgi:hypothetical protein